MRAVSTVQAVASTPQVELFVDGKSAGVQNTVQGIANFRVPADNDRQRGVQDPLTAARGAPARTNITAVGLDSSGDRVSSHTLLNGTKPASCMRIHIDVPAKSTGTGEAMFMDGQDIAMIRVQFMDEDGVAAVHDERNVTWEVSGPVRVVGVSSGNNANPYQQHIQGSVYETYRGLGRVLVQATVDCTSSNRGLARDIDATVSPMLRYADTCPTEPVVITAKAEGLSDIKKTLPYSGHPLDHPLAVARANRLLDYTYMDQF